MSHLPPPTSTSASEPDYTHIHTFLTTLARAAGTLITAARPHLTTHATKQHSADLVTATDRAVEAHISRALAAEFPTYAFIGEETYDPDTTVLGDAPTFIVDPIDGTTNFCHGLPYVCVSIGLAVQGRPVVGVVFNPFLDVLYSAIRGQGAWVTDATHERARLPLRHPAPPHGGLNQSLVAVEWGAARDGAAFTTQAALYTHLAAADGAMVHGLRSLGSAALNLCAVAAGQLDVYWETGCWAWDVCAAWVIVEESGGMVVGADPGDWNPKVEQRRYMAVRAGKGERELVEEFWGRVRGCVAVEG